MAISFHTGATASNGAPLVPSLNITIPAAVSAGDVLLVTFSAFNTTAAEVIHVVSTGTAPTIIGTSQNTPLLGTTYCHGAIFYVVAGASDAGKVITGSLVSANNAEWGAALGAWTGVSNSGPIDVSGAATPTSGASATITCPNEVTVSANDWAVQLVAAALGGATFTGGAGFTQREAISDAGSGCTCLIYDSNASVGPGGTTIGGASFANAGNNNWWTAFTVGLAPAPVVVAAAPPLAGGGMSQVKRRLLYADL